MSLQYDTVEQPVTWITGTSVLMFRRLDQRAAYTLALALGRSDTGRLPG